MDLTHGVAQRLLDAAIALVDPRRVHPDGLRDSHRGVDVSQDALEVRRSVEQRPIRVGQPLLRRLFHQRLVAKRLPDVDAQAIAQQQPLPRLRVGYLAPVMKRPVRLPRHATGVSRRKDRSHDFARAVANPLKNSYQR
jgi:hypothetical protein